MVKKKVKAGMVLKRILGSVAFAMLLVLGLKGLFEWDWSAWLLLAMNFAVGVYLMLVSGISISKPLRTALKMNSFLALVNLLSFAVGLLLIYVGIASLFNVLAVAGIGTLTIWVYFIAGIVGLVQAWLNK